MNNKINIVRCGCNEQQTAVLKYCRFILCNRLKLFVFAFRTPFAIVFYIVILAIYKIYNFVANLTAYLFFYAVPVLIAPLLLNTF